jgi:hypothetical protein
VTLTISVLPVQGRKVRMGVDVLDSGVAWKKADVEPCWYGREWYRILNALPVFLS